MTTDHLALVGSAEEMRVRWHETRNARIRAAVRAGLPLRKIGKAAGVDASTVKRIAERQK